MSLRFKNLLSVLLILTGAIVHVVAAPDLGTGATLEDLMGAGAVADLAASNPLTKVQLRDPKVQLTPQDAGLRSIINGAMAALEPSLFVESLYRYRKPAGSGSPWTEAERTSLYNATLAIGSLAGIEYFSASRNRMRTFYETSTVIDGPETKRPQNDPVYTYPPTELVIYARQKDLTFGDNIYKYTYYAQDHALIFVQENLTAMSVGPIPVVGKNRLRSVIAVIDAGDSLLVYVASMAKAASFPGMNERAGRSFSNRAEAILSWFSRQADTAFEKVE
jgi:hypothetical protein